MKATTKDLRLHTRELIAATERGDQVIITFRGKPRAVLSGLGKKTTVKRSGVNPAFGMWASKDHAAEQSVDEIVRELRKPRKFDAC
jgi:prevent-host-death family protein